MPGQVPGGFSRIHFQRHCILLEHSPSSISPLFALSHFSTRIIDIIGTFPSPCRVAVNDGANGSFAPKATQRTIWKGKPRAKMVDPSRVSCSLACARVYRMSLLSSAQFNWRFRSVWVGITTHGNVSWNSRSDCVARPGGPSLPIMHRVHKQSPSWLDYMGFLDTCTLVVLLCFLYPCHFCNPNVSGIVYVGTHLPHHGVQLRPRLEQPVAGRAGLT